MKLWSACATRPRSVSIGGELVQILIPGAPDANPWLTYAGIWKDHPDFDAVMENIAEYGRTVK